MRPLSDKIYCIWKFQEKKMYIYINIQKYDISLSNPKEGTSEKWWLVQSYK